MCWIWIKSYQDFEFKAFSTHQIERIKHWEFYVIRKNPFLKPSQILKFICIESPSVQTFLNTAVLCILLLFWLNMVQNLTSDATKLIAACLQLGLRTPILCRRWILPLCRVITIKEVTLFSHSHFPSLCHIRYYD